MLKPATAFHALGRLRRAAGPAFLILVVALPIATKADLLDGKADSDRFGSWVAFWDEDLDCRAYAAHAYTAGEEDAEAGIFTLSRSHDEAGWRMSITVSDTRPDVSFGIQVVVPDTPLHFPADSVVLRGGEAAAGTAPSYVMYPQGSDAGRVLQLLRPAEEAYPEFGAVFVDFADCGDADHTLSFLLSGITAALAWIGEKQGRPVNGLDPSDTVDGHGQAVSPDCEGSDVGFQ